MKRSDARRVWLCLVALLLALAPQAALARDGYADYLARSAVPQRLRELSNTRYINVPGRGLCTYYAQANPFWADMRYEAAGSTTYRHFGEGGCCPTSAAIAVANLLSREQLCTIRPYASPKVGGFGVSTGIVNPLNMNKRDGVYWMDHMDDYYDMLPLVFGQFAAGNNCFHAVWRVKARDGNGSDGGTSGAFVATLAKVYGLNATLVRDKDSLAFVQPVRQGATVVALANSRWQPFVNGIGHYVAIVAADDEAFYILDPQQKSAYDMDRKGILDVLEPGLVRVKFDDLHDCHLSVMYILTTPEIDARVAEARTAGHTMLQSAN